jgi:CheY-like chemotaxis protein
MTGILIVDDEPAIRRLAAIVLKSAGYRVMEASNGLEALALFRSYPNAIDLVLTDMVMPVMGGGETIARLRETRPDLKFICMTGYTMAELPKGAVLLLKPFMPTALLSKIREVLS